MSARFLALYETPADPEAFDRHYREVHIPLGRRLPGLTRWGAWLVNVCYVPLVAWGPLLAAVTVQYHRRRTRG